MKIKSKIIRKRIKEKYWYLETVAKQIGITRQGISYILKHGSCTDNNAIKICEVLNLDIKDVERKGV